MYAPTNHIIRASPFGSSKCRRPPPPVGPWDYVSINFAVLHYPIDRSMSISRASDAVRT